MGSKRLDTLDEHYRYNQDLSAICACGHVVTLSVFTLKMHCARRGESDRIVDVARRLRCTKCGRRGCELEPIERPITSPGLGRPV